MVGDGLTLARPVSVALLQMIIRDYSTTVSCLG